MTALGVAAVVTAVAALVTAICGGVAAVINAISTARQYRRDDELERRRHEQDGEAG